MISRDSLPQLLTQLGFRKQGAIYSKTTTINATIMRNIKAPVPPLADQQKLAAEVEALERDIANAQAVIAAAPARKQAIMQRYL
jgi:restriction endonuclease S subunit